MMVTRRKEAEICLMMVFYLSKLHCTESVLCSGVPANTVQLRGLLEVYNTKSCAKSHMSLFNLNLGLAIEYVVSRVDKTDIATPGISIHYDLEDICDNSSLAVRTASASLPRSIWTEQQFCSSSTGEDNSPLLLGYLGPTYSSNARPIGQFLNSLHIPLITPSATLTELSDRGAYSSLFRTTVSDDVQSKALVDVAVREGWSYVLLMHSDDDYGIQGAEAVKAEGLQRGICFSQTISVTTAANSNYYESLARSMIDDGATGIIYLGHVQEAQSLISYYLSLVLDSQDPKYILASDGVGESQDILREFERSADKLGLAVISTYYEENLLAPFQRYKTERLGTSSNGTMKGLLDKFLSDCSDSSDCDMKKTQLIDTTDSTQNMIEATLALLAAFKLTHTQLCGSAFGVCEEMNNSPLFYSTMLANLYQNRQNVTADGQTFRVGFDENGGKSESSATVYRLSRLINGKYEQAGYYSMIRGWSYSDGEEVLFRESRCKTDCDVCMPERPPYQYTRRASPYIIVGTTPISTQLDSHSCDQSIDVAGFLRMEAFFYSVEYIKDLTGIEFSTLFIDTCYAEINTHMILNSIFTGSTYADLVDVDGVAERVDVSRIVVVIGDQSSGISLALQTYLRLYEIPQISYGSSSTWLNDRVRYPMFLRNVPADDQQAELMIKLTLRLGVTQVGLIYQTDSAYAVNGGNLVIEYAQSHGVCLTYVKTFTQDTYDETARDLSNTARNSRLPRVIIIFADQYVFNPLLRKIRNFDPDWRERGNIIIASETWGTLENIVDDIESFVYGSLTFSFSDRFLSWTVDDKNYYEDYLVKQTPDNNENNPLFRQFWQEQFDCYLPDSYSSQSDVPCDTTCKVTDSSCNGKSAAQSIFLEDILSKNILMAGLSVGYAIREARDVEEICSSTGCSELFETDTGRSRFFQLLQDTKIPTEVTSKTRDYSPFNSEGNGRTNYIINNIVEDSIDLYREVYSIENGEFVFVTNPIFYKGGEPDTLTADECSSCVCLLGTGSDSELNDTVVSAVPTPSNLSQTTNSIVITLLVCLVILLGLVIIILIILWRRQRSATYQQDQFPMQKTASAQAQPYLGEYEYTNSIIPPPRQNSVTGPRSLPLRPDDTEYLAPTESASGQLNSSYDGSRLPQSISE